MIISFKYKFIFIKNYKAAGSSIETYLYNYLTLNDIAVGTVDFKGINDNYKFEDLSDCELTFYNKIDEHIKGSR